MPQEIPTRADVVVASLFRASLWLERGRENSAGYMYPVEEPRLMGAYYDLMSSPEIYSSLNYIRRDQTADLIRKIFSAMDRFRESDMRNGNNGYGTSLHGGGYIPEWTTNQVGHFVPPYAGSLNPLVDCFLVGDGKIFYTWRYDNESIKKYSPSEVNYETRRGILGRIYHPTDFVIDKIAQILKSRDFSNRWDSFAGELHIKPSSPISHVINLRVI